MVGVTKEISWTDEDEQIRNEIKAWKKAKAVEKKKIK